MNLELANLIYAGGPGSGCTGPNCGRPATNWSPAYGQTQKFYQDPNGHYQPERTEFHDGEIEKYQNKPAQDQPVLKLVAGGTASGKTTIAKQEFKDLRSPAIVNMDGPRADMPEFQQVIGTNKAGLLQEEASDIRDKILLSALAHNNDIALDAVGSPGLAEKLDALEKAGYKIAVTYVHSPINESLQMAQNRATTATDPADRRVIPDEVSIAEHEKSRGALPLLAKPGREVSIYDRTGKQLGQPYDLIFKRLADGRVVAMDADKLEAMRNAPGEKKIPDIFH